MPNPASISASVVKITDKLFIGPQPTVDDFQLFASAGFKTVINNRPASEQREQPNPVPEQKAVEAAGLSYRFVPVTGPTITEADVRAFQEAVDAADGPVLAHCKNGTRSATLYVIGEVLDGRLTSEGVAALGAEWGLDLSGAVTWITRNAKHAPRVKGFFDPRTSSIQYVVSDPTTQHCAIIDPVLDFDEKSGATSTVNADTILDYVAREGLIVDWILDTHPHADHFSAAQYLKAKTGAPTAIGAQVVDVQRLWQSIYNSPELKVDGSQWDHLFDDGARFKIGSLDARVLFSPGHTLASITYVIGDTAFVHDTLFMPDSGTARADFPGGSAKALWNSIQAILALPAETRVFTGHDYQPDGRAPRWESTVAEQKAKNIHVAGVDEAAFIGLREARDKTLSMPKLILHALQVNIVGGRLPEPENNGRRYLKIPINALGNPTW